MFSYEVLSPQTGNTFPVRLLVTGELAAKGNDGGDFWPVKGLNRFVCLNSWFLTGSPVWGGGGTVRRQDEARSSGSLVGYCQVQDLAWLLCPQVYKQPHSPTVSAVSLTVPWPQLEPRNPTTSAVKLTTPPHSYESLWALPWLPYHDGLYPQKLSSWTGLPHFLWDILLWW